MTIVRRQSDRSGRHSLVPLSTLSVVRHPCLVVSGQLQTRLIVGPAIGTYEACDHLGHAGPRVSLLTGVAGLRCSITTWKCWSGRTSRWFNRSCRGMSPQITQMDAEEEQELVAGIWGMPSLPAQHCYRRGPHGLCCVKLWCDPSPAKLPERHQ